MKFLSTVFWIIYYVVLRIATFLLFWLPEYQLRNRFEKKNQWEKLAQSFKINNLVADYCFEFSSEGEYQQVASLIDDALQEGKLIELIFFSPSVEKTIKDLAAKYPEQIRYLRYPIIRFDFCSWITARTLILVRYDLFPEFLFWSMRPGNTLKMVWVSFKKERVSKKAISFLKKLFLKNSKHIVYASKADHEFGEALGFKGSTFDFRIEQIRRRVFIKEKKFQNVFPVYHEIINNLESYPREKRLIIGNAWPSDLFLLRDLPSDYQLTIVPHKLHEEMMEEFRDGIEALGRTCVEVNESAYVPPAATYLVNKKGVLCELYADFGKAYVGGGFEAGLHSVLEPLVAGADHLAVGIKNQKSTEYDIAHSFNRVTEVKTPEDFSVWLKKSTDDQSSISLSPFMEGYERHKKEVLSC